MNTKTTTSTSTLVDTSPKPSLSAIDASALIVGMVVGVGIFETPALVAANAATGQIAIAAWFLGGIMSLIGALCYAEMATTYPHAGGTYYYLRRAFGNKLAFLFAWCRMTVIQTGSIVLLLFVFGDYASELVKLGEFSSAIYSGLAIAFLTAINIIGIYQSKITQNLLTAAKILGVLLVIGVGLFIATTPAATDAISPSQTTTFGLAMVFVLLTYGGWNEAAYLSAEVRDTRKNMVRVLLGSIFLITCIYLLINWAYLHGLGLAGMAKSNAPAADLMRRGFGENGAKFVSLLVAVSAFGAANATIFTGARTNYVLGQDFSSFSWMGRWSHYQTPANALIFQGLVSIVLVGVGAWTQEGFKTMVAYTAPVFWFFFLLSGIALFVLRYRNPNQTRPFQVPLYPITPLLFCLTCTYLLYSSITYASTKSDRIGVTLGICVLLLGIPILFLNRSKLSPD